MCGKRFTFLYTIPDVLYPAKPGYSHCAEPGRSDLHFSTAGRVKQTLTPPSDKTESGIRLYSASAL